MSKSKAAKEVDHALAEVARRIKAAVKEFNQRAAVLVSRGRYASAEPVMETARSMRGFQDKMKVLRDEWRKLLRAAKPQGEIRDKTPLWEYYKPILEALVDLGGEANRQDFEKRVEPILASQMKAGDSKIGTTGIERWRFMIGIARKPMIKEGFLEPGIGKIWKVTVAGRRAAAQNAWSGPAAASGS